MKNRLTRTLQRWYCPALLGGLLLLGSSSALAASQAPTHTFLLTGQGISFEQQTAPGRSLRVQGLGGYGLMNDSVYELGVGVGIGQRFYNNAKEIRASYIEPMGRLVYTRVRVDSSLVEGVGLMVGAGVGWKGIWNGFTLDAQVGYGLSVIAASVHDQGSGESASAVRGIPIVDLALGYSW